MLCSGSNKRPILVTGSHRSGTTWVGRVLSTAENVVYIHEPFHIMKRSGFFYIPTERWFTYITSSNEGGYREYVAKTISLRFELIENLRRTKGISDTSRVLKGFYTNWYRRNISKPRILIKDPIALFSAEWLCNTFNMDVVILIRHPAAFVSSLKRLSWLHPFEDFLVQKELMRDFLEPFKSEIMECVENKCDIISQGILLWNIFHHVIKIYKIRRPDWIYIRHEDLSREPMIKFQRLYRRLGLCFSPKVHRHIEALSSSENPSEVKDYGVVHQLHRDSRKNIWNWRNRLNKEEIAHIRKGVEPLVYDFYSEADWNPR